MQVLAAVSESILLMKAQRSGIYSTLSAFNPEDCARCKHQIEGEKPAGVHCKMLTADHQVQCRCCHIITGAPNE